MTYHNRQPLFPVHNDRTRNTASIAEDHGQLMRDSEKRPAVSSIAVVALIHQSS